MTELLREQAPTAPGAGGPTTTLVLPLRVLDRRRVEPVRWRATVDGSTEAVLLLDDSGRLLALSAAAAELLGLRRPDAVGRRLTELVAPAGPGADPSGAGPSGGPDPAHALPPLRALATGAPARGLVRLGGGQVALDVLAVPLGGRAGVLTFLLPV